MLDRTKAPDVRSFGPLFIAPEESIELSNGLVLHSLCGGDQDVVRLDIVAEGGASDCDNPCVATFAAELMREGNINNDSEAIADLIDYNGAWLNSGAAGHFTSLQLSALTSKLDTLAPILTDSLISPVFPQKAFEIIRSKGAARQRLNLSRVSFLASADNHRMIAGKQHPESRVVTPEEIEAIDRESLVEFHRRILNGRHIHAYLCGRFSPSTVDRLCRLLETIPQSEATSPMRILPFSAEAPGTSVVSKPGSLQSAVVMSIPAIPRTHPDYNALRMTVTALGGYFGSRLMTNIREDKGYTYGISAALLGAREGGYTMISAQCDDRYTEALIEETKSELRQMVDKPLSDDEFNRLKFNVASDLASTLDSPMTMMDYYILKRSVGIPDNYFEARHATLATIDPDTIREMSRRYLDPDQLRISIASPRES